MKTTIVETTVTTYPHNVEVPVKVEFSDYGDMQFIILYVGNPKEKCSITFDPRFNTHWNFSCKYLGDERMQRGGNTILHGYTLEDARLYAEMMVEDFLNEVHYRKY